MSFSNILNGILTILNCDTAMNIYLYKVMHKLLSKGPDSDYKSLRLTQRSKVHWQSQYIFIV